MLRRRRARRPDERPAEAPSRPAPGAPASSGAALPPPVAEPSVPVIGGDDPHPSAQVLDELRGFFGGRSTSRPATPPPPPPAASDGRAPAAAAPAAAAHPADAAEVDPAELVPEPTKRSGRRSRKEARREQRAEKRRLAAHAKSAGAAAATAPPSEPAPAGAPSAPLPPPAEAAAFDGGGEGVRIVSGPRRPIADPLLAPPSAAPPAATAPPATESPAAEAPATEPAATQPPAAGAAASSDADTPPLAAPVPAGSAPPRATITIVDDVGLPDAVYLDAGDVLAGTATDDGAGSSAGGTPKRVVIDEGDAHVDGEFLAVDVASAAGRIEPRLRERRAQVKKESRKRRLRWVAVVVIVAGVALSSLAVLGSGLFAVDDVRIEGVAYSAGPEFDAILDDLLGTNVFRVDTNGLAERIESIPWVEDARVSVRFPGSATVEVRERTPAVAFLGADNRYRVLDGKGRVIAVLEGRPTEYIEVFVDNPLDLEPGMIAPRGYTAAATLATMLPVFGPAVAEIHAKQDGSDLWMLLRTANADGQPHDIEVRLGVAENLEAKLTRLLDRLERLDTETGSTSSIDVSTRSNIIS